jgi:hypothetical protein
MKIRKIVIMVVTGALFLLCVAGLWFAYRAYAEASKVKATLGGTFRQLQSIYNETPFPNTTNVAVLRHDAAWVTNWCQSLVEELRAGVSSNEDLSSSGFIQKLQNTSAELHKLATAEGGQVLPEGFAFGFERYLGSKSEMPNPENVKRLALQFAMVEAITREMLASHVNALTKIDREKFDGDGNETPAVPGRRRALPAAASASVPVVTATDTHYPRQHFSFAFTADERSLAEVLNRLAKMPLFVVVTELNVNRVDRGLRPRPEKTGVVSDKTKDAVEFDKDKAATLPPSRRVVSGPEIAPLLKAQMQIDVYTFEGV